MLVSTAARFASYRDRSISGCAQLLITKKPTDYDYVAVDVSSLVGNAVRLSKSVATEPRRHREVGRHVAHSIQQLLKKINCRKSLLLVMDGAESLQAAECIRNGGMTRRIESRLTRLPGTVLMQVVEDRVARMMPERSLGPGEVVFSGTRVPGPVEEKITAWALDVAARDGFKGSTTDSVCLIGSSDLFLNVLALTPFYNASSIVQQGGTDVKQMQLGTLLSWLRLEKYAARGESTLVAHARTDALFLYMLCHGYSGTELPALQGVRFMLCMDKYHSLILNGREDDESPAPAEDDHRQPYLFTDAPGHTLQLNLVRLSELLGSLVTQRSSPKMNALVDSYLEHALQSHALLCLGYTPNNSVVSAAATAAPLSLGAVLSHVDALIQSGVSMRQASRAGDGSTTGTDSSGGTLTTQQYPMSAAEYTLLCYSVPTTLEGMLQHFVGTQPKPEIAKAITSRDAVDAHQLVRHALSYADPQHPHRCLCIAPSYCWLQNERTKLWAMQYVDLGVQARRTEIRRVSNAVTGIAMSMSASEDGPARYSVEEKAWRPVSAYPCGAEKLPGAASDGDGDGSDVSLKILSWNVMFDRYSGQPTPLGMPGIDWCSPQRYPVLAKLIEAEDADIVGMQEVEPQFLRYLAEQPWCQERYILSCTADSPALTPWGVLMLIHRRRLSVLELKYMNVPAWSGHVSLMPIVTLIMASFTVNVAAIHLLAPFTKANENARTGQDAALRQKLTRAITGDCVAMGDFNDWPTNEFVMPADTQYTECWPLLHPNDPGKTMDETNTFCKLKIEELFFGRSDKVFLRSSRLQPLEAHLVGTRSVNEENGNKDAPYYLFPSDHYGVSVTFGIKKKK